MSWNYFSETKQVWKRKLLKSCLLKSNVKSLIRIHPCFNLTNKTWKIHTVWHVINSWETVLFNCCWFFCFSAIRKCSDFNATIVIHILTNVVLVIKSCVPRACVTASLSGVVYKTVLLFKRCQWVLGSSASRLCEVHNGGFLLSRTGLASSFLRWLIFASHCWLGRKRAIVKIQRVFSPLWLAGNIRFLRHGSTGLFTLRQVPGVKLMQNTKTTRSEHFQLHNRIQHWFIHHRLCVNIQILEGFINVLHCNLGWAFCGWLMQV